MSQDDDTSVGDFLLPCDYEETDSLELSAVGPAGHPLSSLALSTLIASPDVEANDEGEVFIKGSIILKTPSARKLAAALLNMADDLDGLDRPLIDSFDLGGADE